MPHITRFLKKMTENELLELGGSIRKSGKRMGILLFCPCSKMLGASLASGFVTKAMKRNPERL